MIWNIALVFSLVVLALIGVIFGLIQSRKSENKLIKTEERYRHYFGENISATYISAPQGRLIACNKEYK
jgi:hypothetical protein